MRTDEARMPRDHDGARIDFAVSITPTVFGQFGHWPAGV
jgi:hypothetical protein